MKDPLQVLAETMRTLNEKLNAAIAKEMVKKPIVMTTTGFPTEIGGIGQILINVADNKMYVYADGDWRQISSW